MSEPLDIEAMRLVDIKSARLWLSHDGQDNLTVIFGKKLCDDVEALRERVRELEGNSESFKKGLLEIIKISETAIKDGNPRILAKIAYKALRDGSIEPTKGTEQV